MIQRTLEPELMDSPQEAVTYDSMDHSEVNRKFVDDLLAGGEVGPDVLDLGTGTARIPIELCQRVSNCRVMASDGAVSMLEVARYNIAVASLETRIQLHHADAKSIPLEDAMFDTVLSNSLIHHVPEPAVIVAQIARLTKPGGRIFVRDLYRPDTLAEIDDLVERIVGQEAAEAQALFRDSLHAALTLDEIRAMVAAHGFDPHDVQMSSDRHWTWHSRQAV